MLINSFMKYEREFINFMDGLYPQEFSKATINQRKVLIWYDENTKELFEIKFKEVYALPEPNNKLTGNATKNKIINEIKKKHPKSILYSGCLYMQFKKNCKVKINLTALNGYTVTMKKKGDK